MNYKEALEYLDSFINYEKIGSYSYPRAFKLERMEQLLDLLGNPHRRFKSVHVAGTKGKGSTCAFIHSILKEAGMKAGLYTSPHLISPRERIKINGDMIKEEEICDLLEYAKPFIEGMRESPLGKMSFFEIYTALAFLYFAHKRVDYAVLEVGLGGRLDATNTVDAQCCAITPISFDHMDILGSSIGQIAGEKSGIIKKGYSVISSPQKYEALDTIKGVCRKENASLHLVGKDILHTDLRNYPEGHSFSLKTPYGQYRDLSISLLGEHQVINASCAVGAAEILMKKGASIPERAIKEGLKRAQWPGRLQVVSKRPYIVLDGAQNEESAEVLKKAISSLFVYNKLFLILGVSKNKDAQAIAGQLCPVSSKVILTQAANPRAAQAQELSERLVKYSDKIMVIEDLKAALDKAISLAGQDDMILITGSLFLIGEIMKEFKNEPQLT